MDFNYHFLKAPIAVSLLFKLALIPVTATFAMLLTSTLRDPIQPREDHEQ